MQPDPACYCLPVLIHIDRVFDIACPAHAPLHRLFIWLCLGFLRLILLLRLLPLRRRLLPRLLCRLLLILLLHPLVFLLLLHRLVLVLVRMPPLLLLVVSYSSVCSWSCSCYWQSSSSSCCLCVLLLLLIRLLLLLLVS